MLQGRHERHEEAAHPEAIVCAALPQVEDAEAAAAVAGELTEYEKFLQVDAPWDTGGVGGWI